MFLLLFSFFFFFNDTATTEIYTLSLHGAQPISRRRDSVETTFRDLEEQRQPAPAEVAVDQMPAGHRHQLEQHRLRDACRPLRTAEHVVVRIEALGDFDPRSAV